MSPDLSRALKDAAARPRQDLDPSVVARRARRLGRTRFVSVLVAGLTLVGLGWSVAAVSEGPIRSIDDGGEVGGGPVEIPDGRRYEVISGTYGDDWQPRLAGKAWRLLVWGDADVRCWQLAEEDSGEREGVSCSEAPAPDDVYLGGSTSFYTHSPDPQQFWLVIGGVDARVTELEFRRDGETPISIPLHEPPPEAEVPYRYYAATLPEFDYANLVALDEDGNVLENDQICGPGCEADRDRDDEAEATAYEAREIVPDARAAVFALAALGDAGLLDQFGTYYGYEGIASASDGYLASFKVAHCQPPQDSGRTGCDDGFEAGSVLVRAEGDRFVVVKASGPMTDEQRRRVESHTEAIPDDGPAWRHVASSVARDDPQSFWGVGFVMVWTGNLPPPTSSYGSMCVLTVYDSSGRVLYKSRELPFEVRGGEYFRVSAPQTGLEAEVTDPGKVEVTCDPPRSNFMERM